MQINGKNLCDNCFEQIKKEPCGICGYEKKGYKPDVGILPVGSVLQKRYHIGKVLGKGGFGVTYKAYDTKENMVVAIKEYYPNGMAHRDTGTTQVSVGDQTQSMDFQTGAEKFCEEAKTISRFNGNPNIVGVYDFFYENGTAYFVMEYLDGMDLKHYIDLQGGKLTQENVIHIARVVSDALIIAHSMNVLHRDISPDNIFVLNNGNIKLIDFGAARQMLSQHSKSLSVILKQGFAPLEQYQRKGKQGSWTDIYALGATLYYALTGEVPDDATERIEDPDLGKAEDYGVDVEFWEIINKCMAVKVSDRYEETSELKKALNKLKLEEQELENPHNVAQRVQTSGKQQGDGGETVAMEMPDTGAKTDGKDQTVALDMTGPHTQKEVGETTAISMTSREDKKGGVGETVAIRESVEDRLLEQPIGRRNLLEKINLKLVAVIGGAVAAAAVIAVVAVLLASGQKGKFLTDTWEPVCKAFSLGALYDDDIVVFATDKNLYYGELNKDNKVESVQWLAELKIEESIYATAVYGDYLYLSITDKGIWRADISRTEVEYEQVVPRKALEFALYDRCIFYLADGVLYRAGLDGTSEIVVTRQAGDVFAVYEDRILYYKADENGIYGVKQDGSKEELLMNAENVTDMVGVGKKLYLTRSEKLYEADLTTGMMEKKADDVGSVSGLLYQGGKICFPSCDGTHFYRYDPETEEKTTIYSGANCSKACMLEDNLFLLNIRGNYYRIGPDETNGTKLAFNYGSMGEE